MANKQEALNDALNIVIDKFSDVAWRNGLGQERKSAAADMEDLVENKCRKKSQDYHYRKAIREVVTPFCTMLSGDCQPGLPFNIQIKDFEAERQGRNHALAIVLDEFRDFAHRMEQELKGACSEIAEDMEKQVAYEGLNKSQHYKQTIADVVRPFYTMLNDDCKPDRPINT